MTFDEFIEGVERYWELFEQGLKKQANKFLFGFTEEFKRNVPKDEGDALLYRFCREYIDGDRFDDHKRFGLSLPFQLTELLNDYFIRECKAEKMPQMRWAVRIFGRYYNPHDPDQSELKTYDILEKAYEHPDCDQKTVELYQEKQVECLEFGAHHFPEGCCITRENYEDTIYTRRYSKMHKFCRHKFRVFSLSPVALYWRHPCRLLGQRRKLRVCVLDGRQPVCVLRLNTQNFCLTFFAHFAVAASIHR